MFKESIKDEPVPPVIEAAQVRVPGVSLQKGGLRLDQSEVKEFGAERTTSFPPQIH